MPGEVAVGRIPEIEPAVLTFFFFFFYILLRVCLCATLSPSVLQTTTLSAVFPSNVPAEAAGTAW